MLFANIQQTYSNDTSKSTVKDIFIDFELKKNQENRKIGLQKSYLTGLKRFLSWITVSNNQEIIELVNTIEPSSLVTSYSIQNEKFTQGRYSALITVNFDLNKIEKLLDINKIDYYAGVGPKTLIIPLMSFNDQLVLWDDPNPWFQTWVERPFDANLTEFIIPEGDIEDLLILSSEDVRKLNFNKIRNLALKYGVKKVLVPFLKIEEKEGKYNISLRCFNGLSKEELNIKIIKKSDQKRLNLELFDIINTFTNSFDDHWVEDNIKKIKSQTIIELTIGYESFKEWINIKNIIKNSENVKEFKILNLTSTKSDAKIKIINEDKFLSELENNNLNIKKDKFIWNIRRVF